MTTPIKTKATIGGAALAIVAALFAVEGGYSNNPNDTGGETNHGITKAVAVEHGYVEPMKLLPKELATEIYYKDYIVKPGYLPIVELSPALAEEIIDSGVNAGTGNSSRWFQEGLNALSRNGQDYPKLTVDGRIGGQTIIAYKALERVRTKVGACKLMLKLMDARQATYYVSLSKHYMFTPGWIANRIGNVPLSKCESY